MKDGLVRSVATTYNVLVLTLIAFCLIASQLIMDQRQRSSFENVEVLAAVRSLPDSPRQPLERDLLFGYTSLGKTISRRLSEGRRFTTTPSPSQYKELGFPDPYIPASYVSQIMLRSHPLLSCRIIFTDVEIVDGATVLSFSMGTRELISGETMVLTFFDASECIKGYNSRFSGIIATGRTTKVSIYFLPESRTRGVERLWDFGNILGRAEVAYPAIDDLTRHIPEDLKPFFDFSGDHFSVGSEALEWSILNFASFHTGKLYKLGETDDAISEAAQLNSPNASLMGITAPINQLTLIYPYLLAAMLWSLNRHITKIKCSRHGDAPTYWPPLDSTNGIFLAVAIIYAVTPYLASVVGLILFCAAHENKGLLWGYLWYIDLNLSFVIEKSPPLGWIRGNSLAEITSGLGMLGCVAISLRVSLALFYLSADRWLKSRSVDAPE